MAERGLDTARVRTETFLTDAWRRQVDWYPWGAVLFLSDRAGNRHATVVALGDVDVDGTDFELPWYRDLAAAARAAQSEEPVRPDLPAAPPAVEQALADRQARRVGRGSCFGHFLPKSPICVGGESPRSRRIRQKCAIARSCLQLREYAHLHNKTVAEVLAAQPEILQDAMARREIRKRPAKNGSAAPESAASQEILPSRARQLAEDFWVQLIVELELSQPEDVENPEAGDCFLEQRGEREFVGCCEVKPKGPWWFVAFLLAPKSGGFDLRIRLRPDHHALQGLPVEPVIGARNVCTIREIPRRVSPDVVIAALVAARSDLVVGREDGRRKERNPDGLTEGAKT